MKRNLTLILLTVVITSMCLSGTLIAAPKQTKVKTQNKNVRSGPSTKMILKDYEKRIDKRFTIPRNLYWRVSFWFDIYSNYDSEKIVIHHSLYPWIIYDVVDTSKVPTSKRNRWAKYHRSKKLVKTRFKTVKRILKKLSKNTNRKKLTKKERKIYRLLKQIPGKRKKVYYEALKFTRTQTGQRNFFLEGIKRSAPYIEQVEDILKKERVPVELARLPFVESSYNPKAGSKVGARGIWQFMPTTAKKFMKVTKSVDERLNPLKSSFAAAKLLRENYVILKHWPLAITAYNHGPGGVKKAVRKVGTTDLGKIISRYRTKSFRVATLNFYTEFLAALYVERYKDHLFKELAETQEAGRWTKYTLKKSMKLEKVVNSLQVSQKDLVRMNPELKYYLKTRKKLPKNMSLFIPETS
jgi:membrane-bound lytic murein transglycosylase D